MRSIYLKAAAAAVALAASASTQAAPLRTDADAVAGPNVIQVHNNCHQSYRTHGGSYPSHYHDPNSCQPIYDGGGGAADCHANVQRHWVPGYGNIYHSHLNNCQVQPYTAAPAPTPGYGGCITVGGVLTVCPPQ